MTNPNVITREEGYGLVKQYVTYYWVTNKFYSLKNEYSVDDIISACYVKFLDKKFFEKYNPDITSKKYFVMNAVRTTMIDMLAKYRQHRSIDEEVFDDEGSTLGDLIEDKSVDIEDQVNSQITREYIIEKIPNTTNSKLIGKSPMMGEVNFSMRVVALHLEAGYTPNEISTFYYNEKSGRPITPSNVRKLINQLREYLLSEGLC